MPQKPAPCGHGSHATMNGLEDRTDRIPKSLQQLVQPHIDSFDHFLGEGLLSVVELLNPIEVT